MRPHETTDDRNLIREAKEGRMDAFEELIRRHQKRLYAFCHRITGAHQSADDMAQETFIKAYYALPQFTDGLDFYPWIRKIALNNCLNHLKRGKRELPLNEEGCSKRADGFRTHEESPQDSLQRSEIEHKFQDAFNALPPDQKMIFILRVYENQSYKDISQTLNIPEGTVMSRLNRARAKLKDMLAGYLRRGQ